MSIGFSVKVFSAGCLIAIGLGISSAVQAAPEPDSLVELAAAIETMRNTIAPLRTVTLESDLKFARGADVKPDDPRMQHGSTTSYTGAGAKYVIDYVQTDEAGKVTWSERAAYNGVITQNLRRHIDFLSIEPGNVGAGPNCNNNVFFHPFTFLQGARLDANDPILTMIDFHTPDRLRKFAASCKPLGVQTIRDQECLVFEAPGGRTQYTLEPYDYRYRVYLSRSQAMYPIRWERVSDPNLIQDALDVYTIEVVNGVRVPKVAVTAKFQKGVLAGTMRREILKVSINSEVAESEFTIDHSLAKNISDNGRLIKEE